MRAYFSCPLSINTGTYKELLNVMTEHFSHVTYWKRGTAYKKDDLLDAQVVVIALPDLSWGIQFEDISAGVRKEIEIALKNRVPILLLYKNQHTGVQIYQIEVTKNRDDEVSYIEGIAGTAKTIKDYLLMLEANLTPTKYVAGADPYFDNDFDNIITITRPTIKDEDGLWARAAAGMHPDPCAYYERRGKYDDRVLASGMAIHAKWFSEQIAGTKLPTYDIRLLL